MWAVSRVSGRERVRRRSGPLVAATAAVAAVMALSAGTAMASESSSGPLVNGHSGLCLDVPGASQKAGAALNQWTCENVSNEKFVFRYLGLVDVTYAGNPEKAPAYEIVNVHSGLCVDDAGSKGTTVIQWACNKSDKASQWVAMPRGGSLWQLIVVSTGKCMGVADQGAVITLTSCKGTDHHEQNWKFGPKLPTS